MSCTLTFFLLTVRPDTSLEPRPATAVSARQVRASRGIIANRPYVACLRGLGRLDRQAAQPTLAAPPNRRPLPRVPSRFR